MRKLIGIFAAAVIAGSGLAACGTSSEYDYDGLCRDKRTNVRVDDDYCENDRSQRRYAPVYLKAGQRTPAMGQKFTNRSYTDTKPKTTKPKKDSTSKAKTKPKTNLSKPKSGGSKSSSGSRSSGGRR